MSKIRCRRRCQWTV